MGDHRSYLRTDLTGCWRLEPVRSWRLLGFVPILPGVEVRGGWQDCLKHR
jgi:hypothetical protein